MKKKIIFSTVALAVSFFLGITINITASATNDKTNDESIENTTDNSQNTTFYGTKIDEEKKTVQINTADPLNFEYLFFVDSNNGNDETGDGTDAHPFKSLTKTMNSIWTKKDKGELDKTKPIAIILADGSYDWEYKLTNNPNKSFNYTDTENKYNFLLYPNSPGSFNLNKNFANMNISFIPKNLGNVQFKSSKYGFEFLTYEVDKSTEILKFYGIVFPYNEGTKKSDLCNRIHLEGDSKSNEFYNCVFDKIGLGGLDKYHDVDPSHSSNPKPLLQNCVFKDCNHFYTWEPNQIKEGLVVNCVSNNGYIDPATNKNNKVKTLTSLLTASLDDKYNITSPDEDSWKNKGTSSVTFNNITRDNKNPDGTDANIGVYGGAYSWPVNILNIETPTNSYNNNSFFTADLTIQNVNEIAAEDVVIKYDSSKLKFINMNEVDGIHLVTNDLQEGTIRVILASNSKDNIINKKTTLLKLNFETIDTGTANISVSNGRITNGIDSELSLTKNQLGSNDITINTTSDSKPEDVNKDGSFTLLDLGIDSRNEGSNPSDLPQYNTDVNNDGSIDFNDLHAIVKYILSNINYKF